MKSGLLCATMVGILLASPAVAQSLPPAEGVFITLGTMGGPVASPDRSQPSNAIVHGGLVYLVDVGDGSVQQLARAGLQLRQVKAVFLSHLHADHTGGLAALLSLRNQTSLTERLTIYGPPGTQDLVNGIVASMQPAARAGYGIPGQSWQTPAESVTVTELEDGDRAEVGAMVVTAAQNTHYDFAPGSEEDRLYKSLSLRFDLPGRSIVYTGDTGPSSAVEALASGADLLVSEMIDLPSTMATVARNSPDMLPDAKGRLEQHLSTHHLTPEAVGQLAAGAGVKAVVVTHFAGGTPNAQANQGYVAQIHSRFSGTVTLANDLDRF
ncbi:MBL fold metallo-hydrolase [Brevundimonas variabilis]|uniref:Ribonuclease BN (tRNA processing enzyme) n=1 Tax=Brevundimonas variabilis TaxID=74312 RepID=A0A7W9FH23_9CAUL|nr:MBL fold metallo-hydrolase [Brevundimonas variabilis]MBB5747029.1 ribonuclease BN (tRNA processing enzyme) [Brevundimonas variabilis]